ncbi:MAG: phosphoribosyl-AMP cyclohydrolase [Candidatus Azotimanducaceae bacterium]|jgi:phosphoribosyl-AMP cyclohydrolase
MTNQEPDSTTQPAWLTELKFDSDGLIPAIAQDAESNRVLMVAWMNQQALMETIETQSAVYWSRSRQKLWRKGEESGHFQHVKDISIDCDGDVVLLKIEQIGGIACHTGRESCFYRVFRQGQWVTIEAPLKSPKDIYSKN